MNKKGFILSLVLIFLLILVLIATTFIVLTNNELRIARQQADSLKAFYLAEAGIEKALFELPRNTNYTGEQRTLGEGVYNVVVTPPVGNLEIYTIDSTGYIPNATSPRATRQVRVTAKRRSLPAGKIDSAVTSLTSGKKVEVTGTSDINGGKAAGIKVPQFNMVEITGNGSVKGAPPVKEESPLPPFKDIFGLTKEEMKAIANVHTDPDPNDPDPADGITWIDFIDKNEAKYVQKQWNGKGILIVNGNLRLAGGTFNGIIYVIGVLNASVGNVDVNGAILMENDGFFAGNSSVEYNLTNINGASQYYPFEMDTWQEIR